MTSTIKLRGGHKTTDPRLDRIPQWDPENLRYPIRTIVAALPPRSYTWSLQGYLDQGNEGACVGFSFGQELRARPRIAGWVDASYARESIYWEAQKIDPWSGGSYPGASPEYEGTSVLAGAKVCQDLGHFREYRWALNLNDLILAIGYKGPAVIGINWYTGMFRPDSTGLIKPTGGVAGGHAILVRGVSLKLKRFRLSNSWGQDWGLNGDCFVEFDDMERLLFVDTDAEACIPVERLKVA